jgi:CHAD domain-containing protein
VRDGRVLLDTLDKLVERYGSPARAIRVDAFRRALAKDRADVRRRILKTRGALKPQRQALEKFLKRAGRWQLEEGDWEVLGTGLKRVYADGRKGLKKALAVASAEDLHEWRKQAKYLWHQLQVIEPIWPGPVGELADQAHKLSDYLGDDHDLFVLREKIVAHRKAFRSAADQEALLALVDRCGAQLREKAVILGRRIYEEKPAAFQSRLHRYWKVWKRESQVRA